MNQDVSFITLKRVTYMYFRMDTRRETEQYGQQDGRTGILSLNLDDGSLFAFGEDGKKQFFMKLTVFRWMLLLFANLHDEKMCFRPHMFYWRLEPGAHQGFADDTDLDVLKKIIEIKWQDDENRVGYGRVTVEYSHTRKVPIRSLYDAVVNEVPDYYMSYDTFQLLLVLFNHLHGPTGPTFEDWTQEGSLWGEVWLLNVQ